MFKGLGFKNGNLEKEEGRVYSVEKLERDCLVLFLNRRCDTGEGNYVNVSDHLHVFRASR